jgi:hypothetical protein
MRRLHLGSPRSKSTEDQIQWLVDSMRKIETASRDIDPFRVADNYQPSNFTVTRTINAGTISLGNLANLVATWIQDLKNRGPKQSGG